jgi:hypothetical protein
MPYVEPDKSTKKATAFEAQGIVDSLRQSAQYDFTAKQQELDDTYYRIYGLNDESIAEIEIFCANFYEHL